MFAIRVDQYGGPEVLKGQEVPTPAPGRGQVRLRVEAAGVNFIDTYERSGRYAGKLPFTPGRECAGTIDAVGEGVTELRVGDRVASGTATGAYAEQMVVDAGAVVPIPDSVSFEQAAAAMLQGLTAHYLCTSTYPLQPGEWALVHAGAGGVGLLLTQMAKRRGARVIATVSTGAKAQLSREAGADEVVLYSDQDFVVEARRITGGAGVSVVYDGVGKTTFEPGLSCLRPRGMMVLFGGSSGPVAPMDPMVLNAKGSLFLTRPTLHDYVRQRPELLARTRDLFAWIGAGELKLRIEHRYSLRDVANAHRDLEARRTTGKLILLTR